MGCMMGLKIDGSMYEIYRPVGSHPRLIGLLGQSGAPICAVTCADFDSHAIDGWELHSCNMPV